MYNTSKRCGIFKKEIVTLLAILTVFLFSFFLRIWWYYTFPKLEANIWMQSMPTLLLSIPFDFLPLLLMMILHYRNFRAKKLRKYDQITEEPDEILHLNLIENSPSGSAQDKRSLISTESLPRNRYSANIDEKDERDILTVSQLHDQLYQ